MRDSIRLLLSLLLFVAVVSFGQDGSIDTVIYKMVSIPAGEFPMGSLLDSYEDNDFGRSIQVSEFHIGTVEVSIGLWREFLGDTDTSVTDFINRFQGRADISSYSEELQRLIPITGVTWYAAVFFCNWMSLRDGLEPAYEINGETLPRFDFYQDRRGRSSVVYPDVVWNREANGYRLPTEAEWEYAAYLSLRGIEDDPGEYSWQSVNQEYPYLRRSGTKQVHPTGVFDIFGNAAEWCWDKYAHDYASWGPSENPTGPDKSSAPNARMSPPEHVRVLRGGRADEIIAELVSLEELRVRRSYGWTFHRAMIGVRLARNAQ